MAFKDYNELVEPLVLPIGGKNYTIRPLSIAQGKFITDHLDPTSDIDPIPNDEFLEIMLGPSLDEMTEDGVPGAAVTRAAMVALADFQAGRSVAEVLWETGGDPKGVTAAVAAAQAKAARQAVTTRPAGANSTKRRASGSGTKTSRKR